MRLIEALIASLAAASPVAAQLTIHVTTLPADTPRDATVYVAGTFNDWNPGARAWALARRADGTLAITLPDSVRGAIEFKLTRGSWETVETAAGGASIENRRAMVPRNGAATIDIAVAGWAAPGRREPPRHTASRSVSIVADSFAIPQLGRTRRVWLYLPPGYEGSARRYPVIYMHDGQNVFDAGTSFAGEWGVDETLDSLAALGGPGAIVVAVDHGGPRRIDEYDPWKAENPKYGGGEGAAYVRFLVETLKPWVDARYRTLPDPAHTAIAGSSMGGLISLYAALAHPEVFGRAGVFSCACWISRRETMAFVRAAKPGASPPRLYFVIGGSETADGEPARDQAAVVDSLLAAGFPRTSIHASVVPEGKHAEWFWRREFPAAYRWLLAADAGR